MTTCESAELWVIQPLLEAGLELDEVCELLFLVSLTSLVSSPPCDILDAPALLGHRPPAVRAAWMETVDRMLRVPEASIGP